jgi:hypothetical protein
MKQKAKVLAAVTILNTSMFKAVTCFSMPGGFIY